MKFFQHITIASILFNILVVAIGLCFFIFPTTKKKQKQFNVFKKKFTIGISIPSTCHFTEATHKAFMQALQKSEKARYEFVVFNANNEHSKMRSQTEELVNSNVDLIFAIDATCAQLAKKITEKRDNPIPIVFGGVKGPAEIDLVQSEEASGNHLTGVTGISMSLEQRFSIVSMLKPNIKKVLIVYCPSVYFVEKDSQDIETLLTKKGIAVEKAQIFQTNELVQKVTPFLMQQKRPDLIIILRDNIVSSGADALVKLCNSHNITLFSYHLDHVKKGVAFAIGEFDEDYGIASARLVQEILEKGKHPSQIPIAKLDSEFYHLMINTKTMKQQNLNINPNLLFIMKNTKVI